MSLQFFQLPVAVDQGLPQVFACDVGPAGYEFALYANVVVPDPDPPETIYDFAAPDTPGYLVLRVTGSGPAGPRILLLRKLVCEPGLVHEAAELAIVLRQARVARGNLNGAGRYGSRLVLGVARRWA